MNDASSPDRQRRAFLKSVSTAAAATASAPLVVSCANTQAKASQSMMGYVAPQLDRVRFGVIGTGERGSSLLKLLLQIPHVAVNAICDIDGVSLSNANRILSEFGLHEVATYSGGDTAYRRLLERVDVDAIIIATPWRWHAPMSIHAMEAGKHAFVEVPMATTIDDLWHMVEVSEATRRNCMMMENVCYGRTEMMVLNLVQQGLLGQLTHGEGAYIHDLRWQMKEIERKTGSWRTAYHTSMRGNIYPTHGLGPVAQYMDINRGDRFDYLTSMSSPALGRAAYAQREFPPAHSRNALKYVKGDMNTTLIQTAAGRSIMVQYDTTTARPYSRLNLVQGTNGAFAGYPNRIALEQVPQPIEAIHVRRFQERLSVWSSGDKSKPRPQPQSFHDWDTDMGPWYEHYDHPLWRRIRSEAEAAGGHGGMDFVMLWRIVQCLREGIALDQNVYDGAAWSSLFPLTHTSVVGKSQSVAIPDFTRGAWREASAAVKPT